MQKSAFAALSAFLFLTPLAARAADGFAAADSFRTLTQIQPGKRPGENSITLRWAPVSCVNGYTVHLSRSEEMAKPKISHTGTRPYLNFPTTFTGDFFWQVGCRGEQAPAEAGVETQRLTVKPQYLPVVVPEALTKKIVRKDGSGDSLPLRGVDPSYRHRLEVFSPRLEPLSVRESAADDAFWPSLAPGFYYYRVQSLNSDGQETYATPLAVLQVEGGPGAGKARGQVGSAGGAIGVRLSAGIGFVGQTGTQTSKTATGDLSSGTTAAFNFRAQYNWSERWGVDVRGLLTSATYNDAQNNYVAADFKSGEYRGIVQRYFPSRDKFWIAGLGVSSRNHPFIRLENAKLAIADVRTMEVALRGGVEWRPDRWQHTVTIDVMGPIKYSSAGAASIKGSLAPSAEIELTSYYAFGPHFSVGGSLGARISKTKFTYATGQLFLPEDEVDLKFNRVMGGVLASYKF